MAAEYMYQRRIGGTLEYCNTSGSSDPLLYPATPVSGSVNGSPDTSGFRAEVDYLPWLNTKLEMQYVRYQKFNGQSSNYDGSGRSAADNDTLYLLVWVAF
jgi:hypothetical protein